MYFGKYLWRVEAQQRLYRAQFPLTDEVDNFYLTVNTKLAGDPRRGGAHGLFFRWRRENGIDRYYLMSQTNDHRAVLIAIHNDIVLPDEIDIAQAPEVLLPTVPRVYRLGASCTIGRDPSNHIRVRHERLDISRFHAVIACAASRYIASLARWLHMSQH